ncbi:DUF1330 domain-containing protein [Auraticoccus monumenti]|uniref:Uncharacterized conserved protein, DUF1330 family n=1 Tax=Auraticoccus monumenti TaxID=675864 RepID=A0A1G7EXQ5_9ACTN|nr:DUF1330 domain-containing protein [Auraticoccus monumenti]SDE68438.1 Uncharacterized conserved protein, DUF1330 family [Auraticoccus monumenti]
MTAKGYLLVRRTVVDPELAKEYLEVAAVALAEAGGRFLARGAAATVLEGDPQPEGAGWTLIEFDSVQAAEEYYRSEAYAYPRELASRAFDRFFLMVEGVPVS